MQELCQADAIATHSQVGPGEKMGRSAASDGGPYQPHSHQNYIWYRFAPLHPHKTGKKHLVPFPPVKIVSGARYREKPLLAYGFGLQKQTT